MRIYRTAELCAQGKPQAQGPRTCTPRLLEPPARNNSTLHEYFCHDCQTRFLLCNGDGNAQRALTPRNVREASGNERVCCCSNPAWPLHHCLAKQPVDAHRENMMKDRPASSCNTSARAHTDNLSVCILATSTSWRHCSILCLSLTNVRNPQLRKRASLNNCLLPVGGCQVACVLQSICDLVVVVCLCSPRCAHRLDLSSTFGLCIFSTRVVLWRVLSVRCLFVVPIPSGRGQC